MRHAVLGGEVGEDGTETVRCLNYNAVFTYAVKAIQELDQVVQQQQTQIDAQTQQIDRLILFILSDCFLFMCLLLQIVQYFQIGKINLLAVSWNAW